MTNDATLQMNLRGSVFAQRYLQSDCPSLVNTCPSPFLYVPLLDLSSRFPSQIHIS